MTTNSITKYSISPFSGLACGACPAKQVILLFLVMMISTGCASSMRADEKSSTTVWKLDNLKSIGGATPEILGSPTVVQSSDGPAIRFNGSTDGLFLPINPIQGWSQFTIQLLFKPESPGPEEQRYLHIQTDAGPRGLLELRLYGKEWPLDAFLTSGTSQKVLFDKTKLHPADQWTWVAMTYKDGKITSFVNGVQQLEGDVNFPPTGPGKTSLGVRQNKVSWFKGLIKEVRFDPQALPAEQLKKTK